MTDKKLIELLKKDLQQKDEKILAMKKALLRNQQYFNNELDIKRRTIEKLYAESVKFRKPVRPVLSES